MDNIGLHAGRLRWHQRWHHASVFVEKLIIRHPWNSGYVVHISDRWTTVYEDRSCRERKQKPIGLSSIVRWGKASALTDWCSSARRPSRLREKTASSMFVLFEKPLWLTLQKKNHDILIYSSNSTNMGCDSVSLYTILKQICGQRI